MKTALSLLVALLISSSVQATPLAPAQCTKAMIDCGKNKACQENLKKFNGCTTHDDCVEAIKSCKKNQDCLDSLQYNAGCGLF